jgi:hypothetical protein
MYNHIRGNSNKKRYVYKHKKQLQFNRKNTKKHIKKYDIYHIAYCLSKNNLQNISNQTHTCNIHIKKRILTSMLLYEADTLNVLRLILLDN